MTCTKVVVL